MAGATILYHKEHAQEGRQVTADQAAGMLAQGWVDTPAKFDPHYVEPAPMPKAAGLPKDAPAGYVPKRFPWVMYNRLGEDRLFRSQDELDRVSPDEWKDSPAAFASDAPGTAAPAASSAASTSTIAPPAPADETGNEGDSQEERDRK